MWIKRVEVSESPNTQLPSSESALLTHTHTQINKYIHAHTVRRSKNVNRKRNNDKDEE